MPTFYKRKRGSTRGEWTEGSLQQAVNAIKTKEMGINEASRNFNVPDTTLRRRVKNNQLKKGKLGPPPTLGDAVETEIVAHIKKLQKHGFAPTREIVKGMAFNLAERMKIPHRFNKYKQLAGDDWLRLFLNRYPDLTIRKSEGVSLARSQGMCKSDVSNYFNMLQEILIEHELVDKPGHIFNMDESGLQLNNKPGHVIAQKGSKNVAAITSGEKGETITVIACCNAEGCFIPPVCVFKGKNKKLNWLDNMPPGTEIYMNDRSGYVNSSIFFEWMKSHFVPRKPQGKVLIILDGHASHCNNVEMLEYAISNDVILFCLPSHTTQFLQPLDRSFFKSLKNYYNATCNNYIRSNPTRKINRLVFGQLLHSAWINSATSKNAVSGFRATGIYPFDPEVIPDDAYLLNEDLEVSKPLEISSVNTEHIDQPLELNEMDSFSNLVVSDNTPKEQNCVSEALQTPSAELSPRKTFLDISSFPGPSDKITPKVKLSDISPGKVLSEISPIPGSSNADTCRKRAKQVAEVLTSTTHIIKREIASMKREKVVENKKEKTKERDKKLPADRKKEQNNPIKKKA